LLLIPAALSLALIGWLLTLQSNWDCLQWTPPPLPEPARDSSACHGFRVRHQTWRACGSAG